jgi:protease I
MRRKRLLCRSAPAVGEKRKNPACRRNIHPARDSILGRRQSRFFRRNAIEQENAMDKDDTGLHGMRVAILVTDGFEQVEFTGPRDALERQGAITQVVSQKQGKVQGFRHHDKADQFTVDLTFDQARAEDFDAVLLPGGVINGDQMRIIPAAQRLVQQIDEAGKPVFVICHGGWVLVSAGLVDGRTMTSWPTLQDDIRNAGGHWVDQEAVVDGNWVSSRKPDDIPAFNQKMVDMLHQKQAGQPLKRGGAQQGMGLAG